MEICPICWRTDAFTHGAIDHDKESHDFREYYDQWRLIPGNPRKLELTYASLANL